MKPQRPLRIIWNWELVISNSLFTLIQNHISSIEITWQQERLFFNTDESVSDIYFRFAGY